MNKKILIFVAILFIAIIIVLIIRHVPLKMPAQVNNTLSDGWTNSKNDLSKVKVAILYENIIDKPPIGPQRSIGEIIQLLKETHADLIFRGFWRWLPPPDSPDNIPPELTAYLAERAKVSPGQVPELVEKSGYNYKELASRISAVKREIPGIIFVGAIPAQRISSIDKNDITGQIYTPNQTWAMTLDPQKWNIQRNGKPLTKEEFQALYAQLNSWIKPGETYDYNKVQAFFPDITNPDFQEILVSWAARQIDAGADAIWIDGLPQTSIFYKLTNDINHPAIKDMFNASEQIVDKIHKYGESKGKQIYIGTWILPLQVEGLPQMKSDIDFITLTPTEDEILNKKLDLAKWNDVISKYKNVYSNTPVFAFIDWGFNQSPTVAFSQKLSTKEQEDTLQSLDESFANLGINYIYPVRGGYMGAGAVTKKLSFGKYRSYDALAPEFDTYNIIKELAQKKAKGE